MAYDENLAARIRRGLAKKRGITEKKMFGSVGFLLKGNLLVGVWKQSLVGRLGPGEGAKALAEPYVRPFDITGKAMKGWVLVDPAGFVTDAELQAWLDRAFAFVKSLPAKD